MVANMDTTGTFQIAEALSKYGLITCLHKHNKVESTVEWGRQVQPTVLDYVAVSAGTSERDFKQT